MGERVGIRFRTGDLFPADDPVSRWLTGCMSALNDLLLVNRWLIPSLERDGPDYVHVYLGRLGASHLYEIAKFLHDSERRVPEVREFLGRLDGEARAAHERVKVAGPAGTESFAGQLGHARNHFFHYSKLVPQAPDHEKLKRAMDEHRDTIGEIRDPGRTVDFRARFADDVFVELSFPEGDVDLREFLTTLSSKISDYLDFARSAVNRYVELAPREHWRWIDADEVSS